MPCKAKRKLNKTAGLGQPDEANWIHHQGAVLPGSIRASASRRMSWAISQSGQLTPRSGASGGLFGLVLLVEGGQEAVGDRHTIGDVPESTGLLEPVHRLGVAWRPSRDSAMPRASWK
ncbi:hypothetical protein BH23PLA1_BH23PLA1_03010 [soil metagenome]